MRKAAFYAVLFNLVIFLSSAFSAAAAPRYTCLDLDKVPGMELHGVYPRGIDAAGEVVGFTYQYTSSPALLNPGGAGPAPLSPTPKSGNSIPYAFMLVQGPFFIPMEVIVYPVPPNKGFTAEQVGPHGEWIGGKLYVEGTSGDPQPQAWVGNRASHSATWDLGSSGGKGSWCNAVNDAGQAVGAARDNSGNTKAFLYSGGVMQDLNNLASNLPPGVILSEARGINNSGQVVGVTCGNFSHAFLYDGAFHDLGTIPPGGLGIPSYAYAINDAGQVVGDSDIAIDPLPVYHAFLWDGGPEMKDLGTLPGHVNSRAYGINNAGQVVGYSATASGVRAFLYTDGVMQDLNDLVVDLPAGVVLEFAYGINDRGQIIASAAHGYLLTPITPVSVLPLLLQ